MTTLDTLTLKPVIDMLVGAHTTLDAEGYNTVSRRDIARVGISFDADGRMVRFSPEANAQIRQIDFRFTNEAERTTAQKTVTAALKTFEAIRKLSETRDVTVQQRDEFLAQVNRMQILLGLPSITLENGNIPRVEKLNEKIDFLKAVSENKSLNTPIRPHSSKLGTCFKVASYIATAAIGAGMAIAAARYGYSPVVATV